MVHSGQAQRLKPHGHKLMLWNKSSFKNALRKVAMRAKCTWETTHVLFMACPLRTAIGTCRINGKFISLCPSVKLSTQVTPLNRALLEKLTVTWLVKKLPDFYGTHMLITTLTKACHRSLS
jgi:hypothetical protein